MSNAGTRGVARLRTCRFHPLVAAVLAATAAVAEPLPEPADPHPRLFLDPEVERSLHDLSGRPDSYVSRTVDRCNEISRRPAQFATDNYMGLDWAQYLQACLIAYKATGKDHYGETALRYFRALLDDLRRVGDGAGGDMAAARDSGFAIRALGPNAALAYDWLHDFPGVDEELKARARKRFRAWTDWYLDNGYRARSPATNYHAGYLAAATLIAVAQGSEAGEGGAALWQHVVDDMFVNDTLPAMRGNGVLVGGDWGEGWQYGPLSVAEYAIAGSAMDKYGLDVTDMQKWLESVFLRHIHALVPGNRAETFVLGDTQVAEPYVPVRPETLAAVILGPATDQVRGWAEAELRRLGLYEGQMMFPLFLSLAEAAQVRPAEIDRQALPVWYLAPGTGTLYARNDWSDDAAWFVAMCSGVRDVDHMHPNAGNFVLSLGAVPVIVDPSPYGTLSTLTSNAPTIESGVLPREYSPSQGYWGVGTAFRWVWPALDGRLLVARCDYADQFRLREAPSDVANATRDFVLVADDQGGAVHLLVIDQATTSGEQRRMHLRYRSLAKLRPIDGGHAGSYRGVRQSVQPVYLTRGKADLRRVASGDCFRDEFTRGNCDAARFPVNEYRVELDGRHPEAIHLVSAAGRSKVLANARLAEDGDPRAVMLTAGDAIYLVLSAATRDEMLTVPAVESIVIVLDDQATEVTAADAGDGKCKIGLARVQTGGARKQPHIMGLSPACEIGPLAY